MFLAKDWSNYTVPDVWRFTIHAHLDIITQMVLTLVPDFLTCYLWCILNIVPKSQQTSSLQSKKERSVY